MIAEPVAVLRHPFAVALGTLGALADPLRARLDVRPGGVGITVYERGIWSIVEVPAAAPFDDARWSSTIMWDELVDVASDDGADALLLRPEPDAIAAMEPDDPGAVPAAPTARSIDTVRRVRLLPSHLDPLVALAGGAGRIAEAAALQLRLVGADELVAFRAADDRAFLRATQRGPALLNPAVVCPLQVSD